MISLPPYYPLPWLYGGHLDTIYAKLLQPPPPAYRRELLPDSSGQTSVAYDFIDSPHRNAPLVVLFHGLEGSSASHYACALMNAVAVRGWHGVVAHFRSCGNVPNTAPMFYHSGDSTEIHFMLQTLATRYPHIYAVGVSLGGNALAKYLGEHQAAAIPDAAAVISAPLDLAAASARLNHGISRYLYSRYFLHTLLPKARATGFHPERLPHCKTLAHFDDAFTAPLHGFKNHQDYYQQSSAKPFLSAIQTPTLLLNARNDPFLPAETLPNRNAVSDTVTLLQPERGGHVGFVSGPGRGHLRWLPETILTFFDAV